MRIQSHFMPTHHLLLGPMCKVDEVMLAPSTYTRNLIIALRDHLSHQQHLLLKNLTGNHRSLSKVLRKESNIPLHQTHATIFGDPPLSLSFTAVTTEEGKQPQGCKIVLLRYNISTNRFDFCLD